jgi:hypothetical protein
MGSVIGIAAGYCLDDREVGIRVPVGSRILSFPRRPDRLWGPPNLLSNGYRRPLKRQGREAAHSPPASAEVKKMWIYTSTPHTPSRHSAYLIKHRDNFYLLRIAISSCASAPPLFNYLDNGNIRCNWLKICVSFSSVTVFRDFFAPKNIFIDLRSSWCRGSSRNMCTTS